MAGSSGIAPGSSWPLNAPCRNCGGPAKLHSVAYSLVWYRCFSCGTEANWSLTSVPKADLVPEEPEAA